MTFRHRIPRLWALTALTVVVPLSFGLKFYRGPAQWVLNNWGASFGYELFFMLLAFLVFPRRRAVTRIAVTVCVVTCALEFLQLYRAPWLDSIRSTFLGGALLGNAFSWLDMPAYPVSCLVGWFVLRRMAERGSDETGR